MGPGTDRPVPARERGSARAETPEARSRRPDIDPRTKAGAFGEKVQGPHKPTLDEMGPHAMLPVKAGRRRAAADAHDRRADEKEKRGRRGRPRKTGRPGQ